MNKLPLMLTCALMSCAFSNIHASDGDPKARAGHPKSLSPDETYALMCQIAAQLPPRITGIVANYIEEECSNYEHYADIAPRNSSRLYAIAFHPTKSQLAVGRDDNITTWNLLRLSKSAQKPGLILTIPQKYPTTSILYHPHSRDLICGNVQGIIRLFQPGTAVTHATFHNINGGIESMSISPDGSRLLSLIDVEPASELRCATTGRLLSSDHLTYDCAAWSPCGTSLAVSPSWQGKIEIRDAATYKCMKKLSGHAPHRLTALTFNPQGAQLASGSTDCTIKLWNTQSGTSEGTLKTKAVVQSLAYNHDGTILASRSKHPTISLWDPKTGCSLQEFRAPTPGCYDISTRNIQIAFSHDGTFLATTELEKDWGGTVSVFKRPQSIYKELFDQLHAVHSYFAPIVTYQRTPSVKGALVVRRIIRKWLKHRQVRDTPLILLFDCDLTTDFYEQELQKINCASDS